MRKILFIISVGIVLLSVSCRKEQQADAALLSAKQYYDSLVAGNNAFFIRATYLPDTIPTSYREQLETNAKMFMARQTDEHKGITAVDTVACVHDTIPAKGDRPAIHTANAFLMLTFGDNEKEEIVVPMIEHDGRWLMR